MQLQKEIFLQTEGNQWFERNNHVDYISDGCKIIAKYLTKNSKVLEIGCSNGKNLNYYNETLGCECYGIDPSANAIEYGKNKYPNLNLSVGTADRIAFPEGFFDVVIFGSCLCLVDRNLLSTIIAEGDRLVKDKGFISVIDFDTKIPIEKTYKHYEGVKTYKYDYSEIFLAFPQYSLAEKFSFSHKGNGFDRDIDERFATTILYKDHESYYRY